MSRNIDFVTNHSTITACYANITETLQVNTCNALTLMVTNIEPHGDDITLGTIQAPLVLSNGMFLGNNKCRHCDSTVTLGFMNDISICLNCINDVVIHHLAHQSWLVTNGDPNLALRKELNDLKQELAELKDTLKDTIRDEIRNA